MRSGRGRGRGRPRGRGGPRGRPRGRAGRGKGILRGPRKAAEPTGDIKLRLAQASEAFINEQYDEAREIVSEIIRINAETHEAWMLLASIFREVRDKDNTLMALMYAAHLRPKDVYGWLSCAEYALEDTGSARAKYLGSAQFCYSSAIRADPKNVEVRREKAAIHREMGNTGLAIAEYRSILKLIPHDTDILRQLAEVFIDQDEVEKAKEYYMDSIQYYQASDNREEKSFGWSDVNIYIELYGYLGQYFEGLKELRSLARWLLGRENESFWDGITNDDREWDADDIRRFEVAQFEAQRYDVSRYGNGLPLELRIKLGIFRLKAGYNDEAMVSHPSKGYCSHAKYSRCIFSGWIQATSLKLANSGITQISSVRWHKALQ